MSTIHPYQLLLITLAGWINRHQQDVVDYFVEENRVLKGQLRARRLRMRAHVFLCMLAYYVEWHMRQRLEPIVFDDDDKECAESLRSSIVAPAERSPRARRKDSTKRTEDDLPVHSFRTLLRTPRELPLRKIE